MHTVYFYYFLVGEGEGSRVQTTNVRHINDIIIIELSFESKGVNTVPVTVLVVSKKRNVSVPVNTNVSFCLCQKKKYFGTG